MQDLTPLWCALKFMQDTVFIRVSYGNCFGWAKSMPAWLEKFAVKDSTNADPMFEKYGWGYQHNDHHYYIPKEPTKWPTYIDCPSDGGDMRRCKGMADYDALVSIEYMFSISRLYEYKEIEDKTRKLIGSFITKNQPTADIPAACLAEVIRK